MEHDLAGCLGGPIGGVGKGERGGGDAWSSGAVSFSLVVIVVVVVLVLSLVLVLVVVLVQPVPSWGGSCGRKKTMFPESLLGT